jgi:hypothetical protein
MVSTVKKSQAGRPAALGAQEVPPRRVHAVRSRGVAPGPEDPADGGLADAVAEAGQLAVYVAVAVSDKSAKLRESAAARIRWLRWHWDCDDSRRALEPDLVARTERYPRRWIVIRDGRVVTTPVTTPGKAGRVYDRELNAGGRKYWVAPPRTVRPRIHEGRASP